MFSREISYRNTTEGNNKDYWQLLIESTALGDADIVAEKYGLDKKLTNLQLNIFKNYFAHYRVLTNESNAKILDEENWRPDKSLTLLDRLLCLTRPKADLIRAASSYFMKEGDSLSKQYMRFIDKNEKVDSYKLLLIANMMNALVDCSENPNDVKEKIDAYLNKELPDHE